MGVFPFLLLGVGSSPSSPCSSEAISFSAATMALSAFFCTLSLISKLALISASLAFSFFSCFLRLAIGLVLFDNFMYVVVLCKA